MKTNNVRNLIMIKLFSTLEVIAATSYGDSLVNISFSIS